MYQDSVCRFGKRSSIWEVIFLAAAMFVASSAYSCGEKETSMRLSYFCAEPHPPPEKDSVPVIFLHGITDIKETWNGTYQPILSATRRKVCMYDSRNHGDSSWNDTFTLETVIEDLKNFMKMVDIQRAVLIGHSMGGFISMKFALSYPEKVEAIVVEDMGPVAPRSTIPFITVWLRLMKTSLSLVPKAADEATAKKIVMDYLTESFFKPMDEPPYQSFVKGHPFYRCNGQWNWKLNVGVIKINLRNTSADLSDLEEQYDGKALFIHGSHSPFKVGEQRDIVLKLFPQAQLIRIDKASHFIHDSYPEFVPVVIDFLNKLR